MTAAGPARPRWWMVVAALAMVLGAGNAVAATLGTSASVTIVSPLNVTSDELLRFGTLESKCDDDDDDDDDDEDCSGTVTITTGGQRSKTGEVKLKGSGGFGPAVFTITGTPGASYTITLPAFVDICRDSSPPCSDLVADTLTSATASLGPGLNGVIGAGGTDTVFVGGTLQVTAGAKKGNYRGPVALTVFYQ